MAKSNTDSVLLAVTFCLSFPKSRKNCFLLEMYYIKPSISIVILHLSLELFLSDFFFNIRQVINIRLFRNKFKRDGNRPIH